MIAETQRDDLEGQLAVFDGDEYVYRNGEFISTEGMGSE